MIKMRTRSSETKRKPNSQTEREEATSSMKKRIRTTRTRRSNRYFITIRTHSVIQMPQTNRRAEEKRHRRKKVAEKEYKIRNVCLKNEILLKLSKLKSNMLSI